MCVCPASSEPSTLQCAAGYHRYKHVVYGRLPLSHVVGVLLLLGLGALAPHTDRLMAGGLASLVLIVVAVMQTLHPRRLSGPASIDTPQPRG